MKTYYLIEEMEVLNNILDNINKVKMRFSNNELEILRYKFLLRIKQITSDLEKSEVHYHER